MLGAQILLGFWFALMLVVAVTGIGEQRPSFTWTLGRAVFMIGTFGFTAALGYFAHG